MLLEDYLSRYDVDVENVLKRLKLQPQDVEEWTVIQYPDELIHRLSKITKKKPSLLLFELLHLENPGRIRRTASDYGLMKALETEVAYIFIPSSYRKEQSRFLIDILIEKDIFELEFHPLARFNLIGREIYKAFLTGADKSSEFLRVQDTLAQYFVLVHDRSGSILCHKDFKTM